MRKKWFVVPVIILFILTACSPQPEPAESPGEESASQEETAPEESQADAEEAESAAAPPPTEVPPTEIPPTEEVQEIVHWEFPGEFKETPLQRIFDCVMGRQVVYGEELSLNETCDQWERNYFERPADPDLESFYPQLDIVEGVFGEDEGWYYVRILMFNELEDLPVLDGVYAVEIDLTLDARGEFLILAANPGAIPPDEWSAVGVQVWFDANDDVGGPEAMAVDPRYDGDGYEVLLVDSGQGDDPDLAYVKTYSEIPGLVEIAFKKGLFDGTESFEWWIWAMAENVSAAKFDPVDFFPQDTLFALDNTCGWIYGSFLRELPNICDTISAPIPTNQSGPCKPPPGGCESYELWYGEPDCECRIIN